MSLTKVKAGNILLTTPGASSNDVTPATTQYVTTAIGNLVDTAPSTLNTLNELAAALGDDVNFSTTVTNSIATKLPLAGGTLSGNLLMGDNNITGINKLEILDSADNNRLEIYGNASNSFIFDMGGTGSTGTINFNDFNIGIGTSAPSAKLDLGTSTGQKLLMYANSNIKYGMSIETSEYRMFAEDQAVLTFGHMARSNGTTYTERMRIDATGKTTFWNEIDLSTGSNKKISWRDTDDTFRAGIQAVTTGGQMIGTSSANDFAIRSQSNMLFSTGGNTERVRINSSGKLLLGDSASHTSDLLQIETPASGGGHGIQIRRNDSNTDQGVGSITFGNNTATDLASISAKTDGATDNGALLFNTSVSGGANTERMRIDSSGNTLISKGGTLATPRGYDTLLVQNSDAAGIRLIDAGDGGGNGGHSGLGNDNGNLRMSAAGILAFATGLAANGELYNGGTERMRIDSNGTITQTTSASSPVSANFVTGNSNCDITMNSANTSSLTRLRNGTNDFQVHTNGTERLRINSGGVVTMPYQAYANASSNGTISATNAIPLNQNNRSRGGLTISGNRMTVPVAGAYVMGYHHLGNNSGACQIAIKVNGNILGGSRTQDTASANDSFGTQIIQELGANDYIEFWVISGASHGNPSYNSMWAFLIG